MSSKEIPDIVKVKFFGQSPGQPQFFILDEKTDQYVPLNESHLSRAIPGYTLLNETARKKEFDTFIKRSNIIRKVKVPDWLFTTIGKSWWKLPSESQKSAVQTFLSIVNLFESPKSGHMIMADLLCGMHCRALRNAEPAFCPTVAVQISSPEIFSALKAIIKGSIRLTKWPFRKRVKIRRTAILDYRSKPGDLPHHILDYSQCKCALPGYRSLKFPMTYTDTVVLIVGANNAQIKEAAPYIENAAVILLNSDTGDFKPTKLSSNDLAAYNPEIVHHLKKEKKHIAELLLWWCWWLIEDKDAWARGIVQEARASFGKPDSRYVRVELDPKRLRDAIRYRVLLSFFDVLETGGFMTSEELVPYRQGAKEVFDPAPQEEVPLRHAEDLDVFVEIMTDLLAANADSIVAEDERYVKKDHPFAAWRSIGKTRYLVLDEAVWIKAYKKAIKERKELDASFFEKENWPQALQKKLSEEGTIKHAGNSYRYRYDLYGNGTKDQTYVVAIPAEILGNRAAKSQA